MLIRTQLDRFKNKVFKSHGGLWIPGMDMVVPKHQNILAVLGQPDGDVLIPASNIVTDAGDQHYAERATGAALTNTFANHYVATAAAVGHPAKTSTFGNFTTVAASAKATSSGYPKNNDADVDNTGKAVDVITWKAAWAKADFTATAITHGLITVASPVSGSPLLTGYAFAASFDKTADDTLTLYVNHEMLGV